MENKTREKERNAEWIRRNPEKWSNYSKKWRLANPEKSRASVARWRKNHPSQERAMKSAWNLKQYKDDPDFRRKKIVRQISLRKIPAIECIKCGSKELLQRHHLDYDKPLEVVILCHICHGEEHKKK